MVDIDSEGALQYRRVDLQEVGEVLATTESGFTPENTDGDRLALREDMKQVLVAEGLFVDEAEAMLNTWEVSYFRTEGLRLFFNLPQSWTDRVLPLTVSGVETETKRAMIGRIEMVSDQQHKLLKQLSNAPASTSKWFYGKWFEYDDPLEFQVRHLKLARGEVKLEDFGIVVPADYRAYMDLGRFRDALVLHRIEKTDNKNLRSFAVNYGLPLNK